jgi:TRAP-type transport system small permease protein
LPGERGSSYDPAGMSQVDGAKEGGAAPPGVAGLIKLDRALGAVEQVLLVVGLATLMVISVWQLVAGLVLGKHETWPYELIRYAVFFIAMAGAALAAQRSQMMTMDAVTRLLPPRTRVALRVVLSLAVLAACVLLIKGGLDVRERTASLTEDYDIVSPGLGMLPLPVGAALIGIHTLLHALVDLLYLVRGQVPPELAAVRAH